MNLNFMLSLRNSNFPWIKIMSRHRNMKLFLCLD